MEETELSYFAWLFDGEGCVEIRRRRGKARALLVSISQGKKSGFVLVYAKDLFAGSVYDGLRCRRWIASGSEAAYFLALIRPYVRIKAQQVDVALEFFGLRQGRKYIKRTDEQIAAEATLEQRLIELK